MQLCDVRSAVPLKPAPMKHERDVSAVACSPKFGFSTEERSSGVLKWDLGAPGPKLLLLLLLVVVVLLLLFVRECS